MHLVPRAKWDCSPGYNFFKCDKGPFEGCCASDPCDTGICPDKDTPKSASSSSSRSPATTTSTSEDSTTSTSTSSTLASSTSVTSSVVPTTTDSRPAIVPFPSSTPPSTPVSTSSSTSSLTSSTPTSTGTGIVNSPEQPDPPTNNGALIGGIVGGVLGSLLVVALLIFWFIRRRRKQKAESESASSYSRLQKPKGPPDDIMIPEKSLGDGGKTTGELEGCYDMRGSRAVSELYASSDRSTLLASPMSRISPLAGSPATAASPRMQREAPLTTLNENYSSGSRDVQQNSAELFAPPPPQQQSQANTASELTDTSRVELPGSHNTGNEVKQENNPDTEQSKRIGRGMVSRALSVTTPEGIVLKPNLNQADEPERRATLPEPHVMSFMHYQGEQSSRKGTNPSS